MADFIESEAEESSEVITHQSFIMLLLKLFGIL